MSLTESFRFPASYLHPSVSADLLSESSYFFNYSLCPFPGGLTGETGTGKREGPGRSRRGPAGPKAAGTFAQAAGAGVQQLLRRLEAGGGQACAQGGGQRQRAHLPLHGGPATGTHRHRARPGSLRTRLGQISDRSRTRSGHAQRAAIAAGPAHRPHPSRSGPAPAPPWREPGGRRRCACAERFPRVGAVRAAGERIRVGRECPWAPGRGWSGNSPPGNAAGYVPPVCPRRGRCSWQVL